MTSSRRSLLFLLFFALVPSAACKPGAPKELKTQDGRFSLTVPADWVAATGLSEEASIQARNGERYVTLTSIARDDSRHPSVESWAAARAEKVRSNFTDGKLSPAETITIDGRTFVVYEVGGGYKDINVGAWLGFTQTSTHYHQIYAWTLKSEFPKAKDGLKKIATSLGEPTAAGASSTRERSSGSTKK
jgi:hypothetical protein